MAISGDTKRLLAISNIAPWGRGPGPPSRDHTAARALHSLNPSTTAPHQAGTRSPSCVRSGSRTGDEVLTFDAGDGVIDYAAVTEWTVLQVRVGLTKPGSGLGLVQPRSGSVLA